VVLPAPRKPVRIVTGRPVGVALAVMEWGMAWL
jgi:hypothetical protein